MKKVVILLFLGSIALFSCSKQKENYVTADGSAIQASSPILKSAFPGYSFCLAVPWIEQVPPGNFITENYNCGPTCVVMLSGYFNHTPVSSAQITAEKTWLYNYTHLAGYNTPNGIGTGLNKLQPLLIQNHGLSSSILTGSTVDDILAQAYSGKPCVAGVQISGGNLVATGGAPHWVIVVGYDGCNVIINDPGTRTGFNRKYTKAAFLATWASQKKPYMPVWK